MGDCARTNWAEKWGKGTAEPFTMGRAGAPSNTMSPALRPTSVPSGIMIHQAVWPQQTWAEKWGTALPLSVGELGPI